MTEILTRAEINCETGETKIIPLTDEEIAILEKTQKEWAIVQAEREAQEQKKAEAKASALAKLEELGLTEEEATALIS